MVGAQTVTSIFPLGEMFSSRTEEVEEKTKLDEKYEKVREELVLNALGLTKKTYEILKEASQQADERNTNPTEADDVLIKYYIANEAKRALKSTISSAVFTVASLAITVLGFVAAGPLAAISALPMILKVVGLIGTCIGAIRTVKGAIKAKRGMRADWIAKEQDFSKEFKNILAKHDEYVKRVDEDKELIAEEMSKGKKSFKKFMKNYTQNLKEEMQEKSTEVKTETNEQEISF